MQGTVLSSRIGEVLESLLLSLPFLLLSGFPLKQSHFRVTSLALWTRAARKLCQRPRPSLWCAFPKLKLNLLDYCFCKCQPEPDQMETRRIWGELQAEFRRREKWKMGRGSHQAQRSQRTVQAESNREAVRGVRSPLGQSWDRAFPRARVSLWISHMAESLILAIKMLQYVIW